MFRSNKIVYPTRFATSFAICTQAKVTENDVTNAVLLYTVPANHAAILTHLKASPQDDVATATRLKLYGSKAAAPEVLRLIRPALLTVAPVNETSAYTPVEFAIDPEKPEYFEAGDRIYVALGAELAAGVVFHGVFELFEPEPA